MYSDSIRCFQNALKAKPGWVDAIKDFSNVLVKCQKSREASELVKQHDIKIEIDLNQGEFEDRMFSCDFSYDYVKINGSYRT